MKRLLIVLIIWMVSCAAQAREVINLNRNWQFAYTSDLRSRVTIDVPHTWNYDAISARQLYLRGLANYIKDVNIPRSWSGKRVYIRFYGVNSGTNVFVNGLFVGEHQGGYTGFTYEITPYLKFGETNNIWVRMSNSPQLDYMPINSDFNIYGGIYRDVELIVTEPTHISLSDHGSDGVYLKQTYIKPEKAQLDATVRVSGGGSGTYSVAVEVKDPELDSLVYSNAGRVRIQQGSGTANVALEIPNPHLWQGTDDPFRYEFHVKLKEGTKTVDSLTIAMGLRSFAVDPQQGFLLNGEPYELRGVTRYEDRSNTGNAYLPRHHDEDFELIREMGANAIRMTNYPHSPYFYELCDRNGVIVWSEIPFTAPEFGPDNGYINKPGFRENGKQQLSEMILQRFNNTSVCFWGLFSNISTRGTDSPIDYIKELNTQAHELDPTRLTVASSNQDGDINFITDAIGWSQYLGWSSGQPADVSVWVQQLSRSWNNLRSGIGEYGAGGSLMHQNDTLRRPDARDRLHPERWQTHYHEQVYGILKRQSSLWGTFIQTMFDFGEVNFHNGGTPGVNDFGLVSYDRREKKDAFYFYKANWNTTDPFVYIAEKRWDERTRGNQSLRIYSNQDEVELFVNGESLGMKSGVNGVFRWDGVHLNDGENEIEAHAPIGFDRTQITIHDPRGIF